MIVCDGRCMCAECAKEDGALPFSLWPGRVMYAADPLAHKVSVLFNGANVTQQCRAAAEGKSGWVAVYAWRAGENRAHICACKQGVCTRVFSGRVQIVDRIQSSDGGKTT